MRKLVIFCHLSLDGIAAIPSGELSWVAYDQELANYAVPIVAATDTAIYGPTTFHMMEYWRTIAAKPDATEHEREHALWIEHVEKIVCTQKQMETDWQNTKIIGRDLKSEIETLKELPGKQITVFGSPRLANALMKMGLVDEYQLTISPVILGQGTHLFDDVHERIPLSLLEKKIFASGALGLHYATKSQG